MASATNNKQKIAVVLCNLGAPENQESVQPFLQNLFMDRAIIDLPFPFRWLLARYIAYRRTPIAKANYQELGGGSPLLPNTELQATALSAALNQDSEHEFRCFIAMRYWHPFTTECAAQVAEWQPQRIVILPLYPQFSTTSSGSSLLEWRQVAQNYGLSLLPQHVICCYPKGEGFLAAAAKDIAAAVRDKQNWHLLFSAHGIPKKLIAKRGDPYPDHVEQGAAAIAKLAKIPENKWSVSYQSRIGRETWLQPYTEEIIKFLATQKRHIILYPIAFVSEHSETLVELDIEYQELAQQAGASGYTRVATVACNPTFINYLASLIIQSVKGDPAAYICHCRKEQRACPRLIAAAN